VSSSTGHLQLPYISHSERVNTQRNRKSTF